MKSIKKILNIIQKEKDRDNQNETKQYNVLYNSNTTL